MNSVRYLAGLLGWGSAQRKLCIYTGHGETATHIHGSSGIRTHDPRVCSDSVHASDARQDALLSNFSSIKTEVFLT
jgi:hypothetical protein